MIWSCFAHRFSGGSMLILSGEACTEQIPPLPLCVSSITARRKIAVSGKAQLKAGFWPYLRVSSCISVPILSLSLSMRLCLCLHLGLFASLLVYLYPWLPLFYSVCLSLSVRLSVYFSVSDHLSVCLSYLHVCMQEDGGDENYSLNIKVFRVAGKWKESGSGKST